MQTIPDQDTVRRPAGLTVIVPTRNSNDTLPTLLASMRRTLAGLDVPAEVIVVDDSTGRQRSDLERLCERHGVRLLAGVRSVGGKRNQGAAAACFDVLLFVDSDCEATPELAPEHWRAHAVDGAEACAGPVQFAGRRSWLWPAIDALGLTAVFGAPAARARLDWAPTANLSVRRCRFEEVGGFDDTLPVPAGGEDVDFGLRLTGRGVAIRGLPRAVVRHTTSTWNSLPAMLVRMTRYGRSEPKLMERHPGRLRTVFPGHLALLLTGGALWLAIGLLGRGAPEPLLAPLWMGAYAVLWTARILQFGRPELGTVLALPVSALLDMAHEASRLIGCWRMGHPTWTIRRMVNSEGQVVGEWTGGTARAWCWTLASLLTAAVWIAVGR